MSGGRLRSLSLVFAPDGLRLQASYVRKGGPNPGTVARKREVCALIRAGLSDALGRLESEDAAVVVTQEAGFENRRDTIDVGEAGG